MCTKEEKGKKSVYWLTVLQVVEFRRKRGWEKSTFCCQTKYFTLLEGITILQRGQKSPNGHHVSAGRLWKLLINVNNLMISWPGAEISPHENSLCQHSEKKRKKNLTAWWISWHSQSPSRPHAFTAAQQWRTELLYERATLQWWKLLACFQARNGKGKWNAILPSRGENLIRYLWRITAEITYTLL